MRGLLITIGKIFAFLAICSALLAAVVVTTVMVGGQQWYANIGWRFFVEIGGALAALAALAVMGLVVDRRRFASLGFTLDGRIVGLLTGTLLGAAILCAPIALLAATGAARLAPDLSSFSTGALALGLLLCFFNVITQEALVRSYIFQEIWAKHGATAALVATTILFVALHAAPISEGTQGLVAGVNILLASILLGLAYVRTGALWLPIGIHMGWNALQGPVLGINVTGTELGFGNWHVFEFLGDPLFTGGAMGVEGGLAGLIGPALGIALVALFVKQKPKPDFAPRAK